MRVGIYCGRHAVNGGGIAVYTRSLLENYVKSLSDSTSDAELVIYAESTVLDEKLTEQIRASGLLDRQSAPRIVIRELPVFAGRKAGMLLDQILLPFWLQSDRVEVVHSTSNFGILYARVPQLITVHDLFQGWPVDAGPDASAKSVVRLWYRALFRRQFAGSARFITDCPSVALQIAQQFGVLQSSITVVPLGIDNALRDFVESASTGSVEKDVQAFLAEKKIPPGYVLLFASVDPRKNLERSVGGWLGLTDQLKQSGLLVRTLDDAAFGTVVRQIGTHPAYPLNEIGWVSRKELFFLYFGARAVLVSTLAEGFGLPAVEALALGCPVVSSPIDFLSNRHEPDIFLCDPKSVQSITEALTRCLERSLSDSAEELLQTRAQKLRSGSVPKLSDLSETAAITFKLYRVRAKGEG